MEETAKPPAELRILGILLIGIATVHLLGGIGSLFDLSKIMIYGMPLVSVVLTPLLIGSIIGEYCVGYFIFLKGKKTRYHEWYAYGAFSLEIFPPWTVSSILGATVLILAIVFLNKPNVREYAKKLE